jgi:periplasmic copper chaperone A
MTLNYQKFAILFSILFCVFVCYAGADATKPAEVTQIKPVEVFDAWARESIEPSKNSAIYLVIKNNSNKDYTLVNVEANDIAENTELHESFLDEQGVSRMSKVDKMVVPAGTEIILKPKGTHIMLYGLKKRLVKDEKFHIKLNFDNPEADLEAEIVVKSNI